MKSPFRVAFVDLETSGLSPGRDRVTEIGVVTLDEAGINQWTTLVNPGMPLSEHSRFFNGIGNDLLKDAPRFKDIAVDLFERLSGRLFIAHNARFDCGFLKAEFQRAGIYFQPQVLCSVMLSRKLYAQFARHDLDSLIERHALTVATRHRALPDAHALCQFWEVLRAEHPPEHLSTVIEALLAGPVLPAHLDPSLIDRLPEKPGVYVFHGEGGRILHAGKAGNLKLHVTNYFRIDRTSAKALATSHLIKNITWRITHGSIGARLQLRAFANVSSPICRKRDGKPLYSWRLNPAASPCLELASPAHRGGENGESYGLFDSERKARNVLLRLATQRNLCHGLLGIGNGGETPCTGCADEGASRCILRKDRLVHFTRIAAALRPLRIDDWPYAGPIGVRERSDLHVLDEWRYLGTAQNEEEVHHILETRPREFDEDTFRFLAKTLPRLPQRRLVRLARRGEALADI